MVPLLKHTIQVFPKKHTIQVTKKKFTDLYLHGTSQGQLIKRFHLTTGL
jgi:hypothetical protein